VRVRRDELVNHNSMPGAGMPKYSQEGTVCVCVCARARAALVCACSHQGRTCTQTHEGLTGLHTFTTGDDKWGKFLMVKLASLLAPWISVYVDEAQSGGVCDACDVCLISPFTVSFGQNRLIYIPWEVKVVFIGARGRARHEDRVACCCI
jgi:hypothetical protein